MRFCCLVVYLAFPCSTALAAEVATPRVLIVGIDGCRADAILYSQSKHLKKLIEDGGFYERCDVLGDRESRADTASGPGWSTILTGVFADKHGVFGNDFRGNTLASYPSILSRITDTRPKAKPLALVTWAPMKDHITKNHTGCRLVLDGDKKGYRDGDKAVAEEAVKVLSKEDPELLFIYFGETDSAGHGYGFHPRSPKYTNAIEGVDEHLGRVLTALKSRPQYSKEDWLILVCTDHGGKERGHGGGRTVPEIRTGFLIVHGSSATKGKHKDKVTNADIVPTALFHLNIPVLDSWKLDGKVVGLKKLQRK